MLHCYSFSRLRLQRRPPWTSAAWAPPPGWASGHSSGSKPHRTLGRQRFQQALEHLRVGIVDDLVPHRDEDAAEAAGADELHDEEEPLLLFFLLLLLYFCLSPYQFCFWPTSFPRILNKMSSSEVKDVHPKIQCCLSDLAAMNHEIDLSVTLSGCSHIIWNFGSDRRCWSVISSLKEN